MSDYEQAVFISYAWGKEDEEREAIVNQLDQSLKERGLNIIRDKRDLEYRGSIKTFMERIGRGDCIIIVISDKYLKSPNCMFELVEIAGNKQFENRIFPIVLADANIYNPKGQIQYIKHWETQLQELEESLDGVGRTHLMGIYEQLDLYDRIRDNISELTAILSSMNALTPEMHHDTDFSHIYDAIEKRMEEAKSASSSTRTSEVRENVRAKNTEKSERPRTISVTASSSDELGTIHLSKLQELETHQSSLRKYVEGYLLLRERWDECGTAKSILLEKGINKIKASGILDHSDLGDIRSSFSSASEKKVLPPDLMFDELKNIADRSAQEMEHAIQEVEDLNKVFRTVSPTKVKKIDPAPALTEALVHLNKSMSTIKSLLDICRQNVNTEIGHIEGLIKGIMQSQKAQELPIAAEYSTTIDRDRISTINRDRTSQGAGVIGRSSFERMENNAT